MARQQERLNLVAQLNLAGRRPLLAALLRQREHKVDQVSLSGVEWSEWGVCNEVAVAQPSTRLHTTRSCSQTHVGSGQHTVQDAGLDSAAVTAAAATVRHQDVLNNMLTSAAVSTRSRMSGLAGALPPLAARAARRARMMPMM